MDIVIDRLRPGLQTSIRIITSFLGAVLCLALFGYGARVTWDAYQRGLYPAHDVLPIPDAYVLVIIPVASFMLFVQFTRIVWGLWRGRRASLELESRAYRDQPA